MKTKKLRQKARKPSNAEIELEKYITQARKNYKIRFGKQKGKYLAQTIKARRGFNPLYSLRTTQKGHKTFLSKAGFFQELEAHMIDHPGERLPTNALAKKYTANKESVVVAARILDKHHGLPKRNKGGPRTMFPQNFYETIEGAYLKAQPGAKNSLLGIIKNFVITTRGQVPGAQWFMRQIKALEKKHKRKAKIINDVPWYAQHRVDELIALLEEDKRMAKLALKPARPNNFAHRFEANGLRIKARAKF